jgi:hypothetical protein
MRYFSIISVVNVLISSGFSIVGVLHPQAILPPSMTVTAAATTYALYAAARTLPLTVFVLAAAVKQARVPLLVLGFLAGLVQILDAGVGFYQGDLTKVFGPLAVGILQLWAVGRVLPTVSALSGESC